MDLIAQTEFIMNAVKSCIWVCSPRRPRRRIYLQNAAEDGGLSLFTNRLW